MIQIIKAQEKHLEQMYKLHLEIISELPPEKIKFHDRREKDMILKTIKDNKSVVTLFNNEVVAYSLFKNIYNDFIKGDGAIVKKEYRGLGLQLLMYKLVKKTTTENILIRCSEHNKHSLNNIKKIGLKLINQEDEMQLYILLR